MKKDAAQNLPLKMIICLTLFLECLLESLKLWRRKAVTSLETLLLLSSPAELSALALLQGWVKSVKVILESHHVGCGHPCTGWRNL